MFVNEKVRTNSLLRKDELASPYIDFSGKSLIDMKKGNE